MFLILKIKEVLATAGRARIEQQKQTALANIQKNKEAAITALNIQYANAEKAKTSFGYIGITFIAILFGSIFLNDFIKLCIYLYRCRGNANRENPNQIKCERAENQVQLEMDRVYGDKLEEKLERVYFRLLEVNASRVSTNKPKS